LQEVAAARQVLIKCGSFEMDGSMFSSGLESLRSLPQNLMSMNSHAHVVRELLRPKYIPAKSGQMGNTSLGISSLGELIEKYHIQEATKRHDKVYALLGMSTDDLTNSGLLPDYEIPWSELFKRVIKYLLSNEILVRTWDDKEVAIIQSAGQVIGRVQSVENGADAEIIVHVRLTPHAVAWGESQEQTWRLPALARTTEAGDIICHFKGASKMSVVRRCHTHFFVVLMTAAFSDLESKRRIDISTLSQWTPEHTHEFLLFWQWAVVPYQSKLEEPYYTLMEHVELRVDKMSEKRKTYLCRSLAVLKAVPILWECNDSIGVQGLEKALGQQESVFGKEDRITLALMDMLLLTYQRQGHPKWHAGDLRAPHSGSLLWELLVRRCCLLGSDHPDTLATLRYFSTLETSYPEAANLLKPEADVSCITKQMLRSLVRDNQLPLMRLLLLRVGHRLPVPASLLREGRSREDLGASTMRWLLYRRLGDVTFTGGAISYIVRKYDESTFQRVLGLGQQSVPITSKTLEAAAGNKKLGKRVLPSLFDREGGRIAVTEAVIGAALKNKPKVEEILPILLDQGGGNIPIPIAAIEDVIKNDILVPKVLQIIVTYLWQRNEKIELTPTILEGTARHTDSEYIMDMLLFGRSYSEVQITSKALEIAAAKPTTGLMQKLLQIPGCKLKINAKSMETAMKNTENSEEMFKLLLSTSDNIQINEKTLVAVVQNSSCGYNIMQHLVQTRPWQILITERIVSAALEMCIPLLPSPYVVEILLDQKYKIKCDDKALNLLMAEEKRREIALEHDRKEDERYEREQNRRNQMARYGVIGGELSYRKSWVRDKLSGLRHNGSMTKLANDAIDEPKTFM
jgi:hypothetical protein